MTVDLVEGGGAGAEVLPGQLVERGQRGLEAVSVM